MALFDRDYMQNNNSGKNSFFADGNNMLWLLIAVNAAFFLFFKKPFILKSYDLSIIDMAGSIFSHWSFGHLFFNMFSLYVFGSLIARRTGAWKFLGLYLASGIIGNLVFMACFHGEYRLLGASGAVFGIMIATAMLDPDRRFVLIFLPFFPIKTKTLIIAFTVIELVSQMSNSQSNTAHLAHLGGFIGGYIFTLIFLKKQIIWNPLKFNTPNSPRKAPNVTFKVFNPDADAPVTQKELDYLLDKISRDGINSLSENELARLKKARKQMQEQ